MSSILSAQDSIQSLDNELSTLCKLLTNLAVVIDTKSLVTSNVLPLEAREALSELLGMIMLDFKELKVLVDRNHTQSADGVVRELWK